MQGYRFIFSDSDLLYLVKTLVPQTQDASRMIRVLRDDPEILEGMLKDPKLAHRLLDDPQSILQVSPSLLFAVLLRRVRADLEKERFTLEHSGGRSLALFDTPQIVALLDRGELLSYLTEMLVSFVRVSSFSTVVRVKHGVWRRVRFSDFDLDSLLSYASALEEARRFPVYKRAADVCLFTLGIMPPEEADPLRSASVRPAESHSAAGAVPWESLRVSRRRTRQDYLTQGSSFYRLASRHPDAEVRQLSSVMGTLAEKFALAVKPLSTMSSKYLAPFKEKVFLQ
ncbi:MAG TPA: hypothetical protein VFH83_10235 [Spirochaetia bacterium]|nr:hypothetical protein [Spirochaetia bacterium]